MKTRIALPVLALFLIATTVGEHLESLPYMLKSSGALMLIVITVVLLIRDKKARQLGNEEKQ